MMFYRVAEWRNGHQESGTDRVVAVRATLHGDAVERSPGSWWRGAKPDAAGFVAWCEEWSTFKGADQFPGRRIFREDLPWNHEGRRIA